MPGPVVANEPLPGLKGSQWITEIAGRNMGSNWIHFSIPGCQILCVVFQLAPGESFSYLPTHSDSMPGGALLWVFNSEEDDLGLSLRVRDLSRSIQSRGTEIPIVTEKEALCNPAHFFGIPTGLDHRVNLRIYDFASAGPESYEVRIYDHESDELLKSAEVQTSGAATIFEPSYVLLSDVTRAFPDRLTRIEVEPVTPGYIYWSFVTLTSNETQQVTAIRPRSIPAVVEFGRCDFARSDK